MIAESGGGAIAVAMRDALSKELPHVEQKRAAGGAGEEQVGH